MDKWNLLAGKAGRVWPGAHAKYEQLCSAAAAGQLGGAEMDDLNRHLAACPRCRGLLATAAAVSLQTGSLLAAHRPAGGDLPDGMRARFLSRLAAEQHLAGRVIEIPRQPVPAGDEPSHRRPRTAFGVFAPWRIPAAMAACAVIGIAGFVAGQRVAGPVPPLVVNLPAPIAPQPRPAAAPLPVPGEDAARLSSLTRQRAQLSAELALSRQQLAASLTAQASLDAQYTTLREKLAAASQSGQAAQSSQADAQNLQSQIAGLNSQVRQLRLDLADSDRRLNAHKRAADDLALQLESTESDLRHEREWKAARAQLGDVLGARNLHIVDVYDADGNGKRQTVGRVFYIENKSLVFYAYDLDKPGRFKADVAFHVWGDKIGGRGATQNLGILHKEDAGESRWALTFDDPKVLAQINSVFVTVETAGRRQTAPSGRKVLSAYFGNPPNHPGGGL